MSTFKMEKDLQKEIQYLTSKSVSNIFKAVFNLCTILDIIQAHKKSSNASKSTLNHRWTVNNRYNRPSSLNKPHKKSSRVFHGNRVYKPMEATANKEKATPVINRGLTVKPKSTKLSSVSLSSSSSTVVEAKKAPDNRVYKPTSSSKPSTSAQTVETKMKSAKNDKMTGSKFKWKRQSVGDNKKPSMFF